MKKTFLKFFITSVILTACTKKNNESSNSTNNINSGSCKLTQIIYSSEFDLSENSVTANVNYSGTQIESILPLPYKFQYIFRGNSLVRRNYYEGNYLFHYDSLNYNSTGAIIMLRGYKGNSRVDSNIYHYYAGNLSKIEYYHQDSAHAGPLYYTYTDFSFSNLRLLTKVNRFNSSNQPYDSYTYTYGTKENKLFNDNNAINLYLQLSDYLYGDKQNIFYDGFLRSKILPESITHFDDSSTQTYTLTYEFNTNNYPTTVKANGVTVIQFRYDCQ